jgi:branched-subunit amino acid transport protein AzlD
MKDDVAMTKKLVKLRFRLEHISYWKFVLLQTGLFLGMAIPILIIKAGLSYFGIEVEEPPLFYSNSLTTYFWLILFAFVETLLFQTLPFLILRKINNTKMHPTWYIIISALLFGIAHVFNGGDYLFKSLYCIRTFSGGIVLAISYYLLHRRRQLPLLSVTFIHWLNNMLSSIGSII